jgi:hypothetical protein
MRWRQERPLLFDFHRTVPPGLAFPKNRYLVFTSRHWTERTILAWTAPATTLRGCSGLASLVVDKVIIVW